MNCAVTREGKRELTEKEAIRQAQAGDSAGFEYLYNAHRKRVYIVCLRILKNVSDAEDMTQQIFLRLFRDVTSFRGDSSFSTWLHRVAFNTALSHLRRRRPEDVQIDSPDPSGNFETPREFGAGDLSMLGAVERVNLARAISQLPPDNKRLFMLHDVLGYRHGEIAKLVGCSVACSKSQIHRARKRLRDLLHTGARKGRGARRLRVGQRCNGH